MDDFSILKDENIDYLDDILFDDKKQFRVASAESLSKIPPRHLQLFGHRHGIYSFPTDRLAQWLKAHFDMNKAIEIGSGNGALAKYLDIPATDSRMHERPEVKLLYGLSGQPVTKYGPNVLKYDAVEAVKKFRPETVIAQWVTHKYNPAEHEKGGNVYGIDEEFIINNVKYYVFIGNTFTHGKKLILKYPHESYRMQWIFSRSQHPHLNIIHIWKNNNYDYYDYTKGNNRKV